MYNTPIKQRLLLLLLFLLCSSSERTWSVTVADTLLVRLDNCLERADEYVAQKEGRIASLRGRWAQTVSDEERYEVCRDLFDEYKSYKYDSAFAYANRSLRLAEKLKNSGYIAEANTGIVFCLLSSGLFKEAFDVIERIDISGAPLSVRRDYYYIYIRLYYDIADYNREVPFRQQYIEKGGVYTDSLLTLVAEKSADWWYAVGQRQMKEERYNECIASFITLLEQPGIDRHIRTIAASCLGWVYGLQDDKEQSLSYLVEAVMGDIHSATKETVALRLLATLLSEMGDVGHANRYIKFAAEDADFYNARHRKVEVGAIQPVIEQGYLDIMKRQRNLLIGGIVLFFLLFILLFIAACIIRKQMKKLNVAQQIIEKHNHQLQQANRQLTDDNRQLTDDNRQLTDDNRQLTDDNKQLSDTNKIENECIGYAFCLNSEYIGKMEALQKMVKRKIAASQFEGLRAAFRENPQEEERSNMYVYFDETFLKLFPNFIIAYNSLFPEPESRWHEDSHSLTPEMRIFALIRLGINDSERIAKFLNYSVHTINTYKTRIKNKSIVPNEQFESKIMEIRAVAV